MTKQLLYTLICSGTLVGFCAPVQARLTGGVAEFAASHGWFRFDTREMDAAYTAAFYNDWNTAIINFKRAMVHEEAKGGSYNWNYCLWSAAESGLEAAEGTKQMFPRSHPQIGQSAYYFASLYTFDGTNGNGDWVCGE